MHILELKVGSMKWVQGLALSTALMLGPGLAGPAVAAAPVRSDVEDDVSAYLENLADRQHVPGLAAATIDETGDVEEYLLGEDGDGSRVDRDTPFLIGSLAKSMTATLVTQLVDEDQVDLDESVSTYLDWFEEEPPPTVEQLLTHTSGYSGIDGLRVSERFDNEPGALGRAARDLSRTGDRGEYSYSSANYLLLGAVIEKVTDRSYADVLETDLLDPLHMDDTSASADEVDTPPGHRIWWGQRAKAYDPGFDESGAPFGYIVSTLADLERYAAAQSGHAPDSLSRPLLDRMQTSHTGAEDDGYGYGWRIRGDGEDRIVHHDGSTPGYFTHLVMGADGVSVVLLANSYSQPGASALGAAAEDLHDIIRGGNPAGASSDALLLSVPWILGAVALAGLAVALCARRRPRRRVARWTAAVGSVLASVGLWMLPGFLGANLHVMRNWFPDAAIVLIVGMVTWSLAALMLVLPRVRGRGEAPAAKAS